MKKFAACSGLFFALTAVISCVAGEGLVDDEPAGLDEEPLLAATEQEVAASGDLAVKATGSFSFSATNTNSALQNTVNRNITLAAGQQISLGSCGVAGASVTGDSYIRFFNPSGSEVAYSDDSCGGTGSNLSHFVSTSGVYQIRVGCYSSTACSGTVAWTTNGSGGVPSNGSYTYIGANTNSAQQNTTDRVVSVTAGQRVTASICGPFSGDPYLRINGPDGTLVGYNDDGCAIQGATHTFIAQTSGAFTIRAGCFSSTPCTGTVVWSVQTP